jgi:hypothetical protein
MDAAATAGIRIVHLLGLPPKAKPTLQPPLRADAPLRFTTARTTRSPAVPFTHLMPQMPYQPPPAASTKPPGFDDATKVIAAGMKRRGEKQEAIDAWVATRNAA